MDIKKASKEMEELVELLNRSSDIYYNAPDAMPLVSDMDYDILMRKLETMEESEGVVLPYSPTQRVGTDNDNDFTKTKHTTLIGSLSNALDYDELSKWLGRLNENEEVIVQPKLDGVSLVITYTDGKLTSAVTRGNGTIGDDVTENAKTINGIPLTIRYDGKMIVRGEVVVHTEDFENGWSNDYVNPRNFASGSLKLKRSSDAAKRPLQFYAFEIIDMGDTQVKASARTVSLSALGFQFAPTDVYKVKDFSEDITTHWKDERSKRPYEADGVVIRVNDPVLYSDMGVSSKKPNGAIAYKFQEQVAYTTVKSIRNTVGVLGTITPTAILEPIEVGGVTISKASLHNYANIDALDLRIFDTVELVRSGDVIPYIKSVILDERRGLSVPVEHPTICPSCGEMLQESDSGKQIFCPNYMCRDQVIGRLDNWVSKEGMDFDGIGISQVTAFYDQLGVRDVFGLYNLNSDDMLELDGFGKRKVQKFESNIKAIFEKTWEDVLRSLSIPLVGRRASNRIAPYYGAFDIMAMEDYKQIAEIEGVGNAVAKSVWEWLQNIQNQDMIQLMWQHGFPLTKVEVDDTPATGVFAGKGFLLTGTMSVARKEVEGFIKDNGGNIVSISKADYLVIGDNPGSKLAKAQKKGVNIITEDELRSMVQ